MATIFPPPNNNAGVIQQSPPQVQPNQHVGPKRTYTPYVFQPNFLKQQMRQRREQMGLQVGANTAGGVLTGANSMPLNNELGKFPPSTPQSSSAVLGSSLPQQFLGGQAKLTTPMAMDDGQRKKSGRKVIDWTSSCVLYLENRKYERDMLDVSETLPDTSFTMEMQSVAAYKENPVTSITSKFVRSATNKMKCPVYKVVWTPDGRRLVTGSASGEFTLWNGTAFNFETILQAHDSPVRAMAWSKHDNWLITGDNQGYIKYWQLNMNNVKMYQAHKDQACRSVSFGPTDHKFTTASDDGTVRVWDFLRCHEERILRGHGADVKQVDWHPYRGLILSASKDLHTPVKLWDPKAGQSLTTIHAHKGTVMDVKWNNNGNWFLSASRDHLIKLYDVRNLKQEMQIFRGHKKEAFSVSWHPIHEDLFASGGSEGSILFWQVGEEKEAGSLEGAHESLIWSLAWHPLGHVLVSGSNDHSTKFWARNRPGDTMRDRYNLFHLPQNTEEPAPSTASATSSVLESEEKKAETSTIIPGMGDANEAAAEIAKRDEEQQKSGIPGLDWSYEEKNEFERKLSAQHDRKKIPYARPVPRDFVAAWEANKEGPPPPRPWSPYRPDWDHWHRRPHYDRPYDDDRPPREFMRGRPGSPFRDRDRFMNGPGGRRGPAEHEGDDRIFVDGVEVGPEYVPNDVKEGEKMESEDMRPGIPPGPDRPRGRGRLEEPLGHEAPWIRGRRDEPLGPDMPRGRRMDEPMGLDGPRNRGLDEPVVPEGPRGRGRMLNPLGPEGLRGRMEDPLGLEVPHGRGRHDDMPRGRGHKIPMGRGMSESESRPGGLPGLMDLPDRFSEEFPSDMFPPEGTDPQFHNEMGDFRPNHFPNSNNNQMPLPDEYDLAVDEAMEQGLFFNENGQPLDEMGLPLERMDMLPGDTFSEMGPMQMRGMRGRGGDKGGRGRGFPGRDVWGPRGRRSPPRMRRGMRPPR